MNQAKISQKIKEVEKELSATSINFNTTSYIMELLETHKRLWDLAYFKKFQEKTYLEKVENE